MRFFVLLLLSGPLVFGWSEIYYERRGDDPHDLKRRLESDVEDAYESYLDELRRTAEESDENESFRTKQKKLWKLIKEDDDDNRPIDWAMEKKAEAFLVKHNKEGSAFSNKVAKASFNYNTNLTDANQAVLLKWKMKMAGYAKQQRELATKFPLDNLKYETRRQLKSMIISSALEDKQLKKELLDIISKMSRVFGSSKVCELDDPKKCHPIEPDLLDTIAKSRDWDRLVWAWQGWRNVTGPPTKKVYPRYAQLINIGPHNHGWTDEGQVWRYDGYEEDQKILRNAARVYDDILPLYKQFHAYLRRKLFEKYPGHVKEDGGIPANLMGDMWAAKAQNILDIILPYPEVEDKSDDQRLKDAGYTPMKLLKEAEHFFTSIGLYKMTPDFWNKSMFIRPKDGRNVVCHAAAEDFSDGKDFRLKVCLEVSMEYFETVHHEMGHIEYYMSYRNQTKGFRAGANEAFHEAVGDTIQLSVMTSQHLEKLGIRKKDPNADAEIKRKRMINFLVKTASKKLTVSPWAYGLEMWRYGVFEGKTKPEQYNRHWWETRLKYQGMVPPVSRSDQDFDPGCKYHIDANVPYLRYFFSFVIQFTFHKSLCEAAGHKGPLHECDIYQSKAAGSHLHRVLEMGSSRPWEDAMEVMNGKRRMDASALLEYFQPMYEWLKEENKDEHIGWKDNLKWSE